MASLYGFKVKNVKTFPGRDWEGVTADLWYEGKKIALYADYGDGAMSDLTYYNGAPGVEKYEPIVNDTVKRMAEDERFDKETRDIMKDSNFMEGYSFLVNELIQLTDDEKQFKKIMKQGFTCVAFYQRSNGKYYAQWFMSKEDKKIEALKTDPTVSHFNLYTSLEDFEIK